MLAIIMGRLLSDVYVYVVYLSEGEDCLIVLCIEQEMLFGQNYMKIIWLREVLEYFFCVKWYIYYGQVYLQFFLVKVIYEQCVEVEKCIEKEEVQQGCFINFEKKDLVCGVQIFFCINYCNYINFSVIVDNKVNIMISVNVILVLVLIIFLFYWNIGENFFQILLFVVVFLVIGMFFLIFVVFFVCLKVICFNFQQADLQIVK